MTITPTCEGGPECQRVGVAAPLQAGQGNIGGCGGLGGEHGDCRPAATHLQWSI